MTWSFRETVVIGMLREQGHTPQDSPLGDGWIDCARCQTGWFLRKRAAMADGSIADDVGYHPPLDFGPCKKVTDDESPA